VKTITFYSYKGGVGRTLLLANLAKYLCRFGQKVFALDFDLEAPGLHYKLTTPESRKELAGKPGVVDYVYSFVAGQERPPLLAGYTLEVEGGDGVRGNIRLMPAGDVSTAEYWRRLARINWHDMVYSEGSRGIPFFLELKAKIETEFAPDYLLIDSRTGITEIGGIATTVLPDTIVCLLLNNPENLEGAREVLRSIRRTRRARDQETTEVVPVLSRLPTPDQPYEADLLEFVRAFLNEEAPNIEDSLSLARVFALHTERSLEKKESLLIESADADSLLLRDYIHLIAQLVPNEVLLPQIVSLVRQVMVGAWDDPENAEKALIALCERSTTEEPFQALLKICLRTKADKIKTLDYAVKYWRMCGRADDPLLMAALRDNYAPGSGGQPPSVPLEFVEAVWRAQGARDSVVGQRLVRASLHMKQPELAWKTVESMLANDAIPPAEAGQWLGIAVGAGNAALAGRLITRYKKDLAAEARGNRAFSSSWLTALVALGDRQQVLEFLDEDLLPSAGIQSLVDYYQVLLQTEREDASSRIRQLLGELPVGEISYLQTAPSTELRAFWGIVDRLKLEEALQSRLDAMFPAEFARQSWEKIKQNRPPSSPGD